MQLMEDDFPATPEEQDKIEEALKEKWNPAEHIIHLFERNKELLAKYNDMLGNAMYTPEEYIQKMYMAIKNTMQFDKYCVQWKAKPLLQRNTEALCQTYFLEAYNEFDAQRDSLHEVDVANAIAEDLEGGLQVAQNQIAELLAKLNAQQQDFASFKTAATATITASNDNSKIISQMTAITSQHASDMLQMRQQNELLRQQLAQQLQTIPVPNNGNTNCNGKQF